MAEDVLSLLNVAIRGLDLAKEVLDVTPAAAVFGSASILLTMIRDTMTNEQDYVDLGLYCADICRALVRGVSGKKLGDLSKSVCDAIDQLTITVAEIQKKVLKQSERRGISRLFHAGNDKDVIAGWKSDLNRVLVVFNTELILNTHTIVADIHQDVSRFRDGIGGEDRVSRNGGPGELPPPPPRLCFGRDKLIERIVHLAQRLTPIALIGAGGIGKTSIILTILHDERIKQRFGDNRWFVPCDQFPAAHTHFLRRLSQVIGAGIENPKDLTSLRRHPSSKEMLIILDNAESILDSQGTSAQEIYAAVDELSRFSNVCLAITSRISTIPPHCETINIPTLSTEAAYETFYRIYKHSGKSDPINRILKQLDFHPLSITLLAITAQHNQWDTNRVAVEWERRRTGVLHTQHSRSLADTIKLSLTSPMFQELGPDAQALLGVVAFFPQGVNEKNVDWLFPTIPNGRNMFDKLCTLSLTYRSGGFMKMLAPLRDHFCPKNPESSPLLIATKERYFDRLSRKVDPDKPDFGEARWITSEDVNVEHLLDAFTSIDVSEKVWNFCAKFMEHLYWHKPRLVILGPKIEALPDGHPSKPRCLSHLSRLLYLAGNWAEQKRILTHVLKLRREQGDDDQVAQTLRNLSGANHLLGFVKEGIQQVEEASEIFGRLGVAAKQAGCLIVLASLLHRDRQLNSAEDAASQAIGLLPKNGEHLNVCQGHRVLGEIHYSKGETKNAIYHFKVALGIASPFNWHDELFGVHFSLADLFSEEGKLNDAHTHLELAKSHAVNDTYLLARASRLQAGLWIKQRMLSKAKVEALRALEVFEKFGAGKDAEKTRQLLKRIDRDIRGNRLRSATC